MASQDRMYFLRNVRCSFPHLFERPIINGNEGKCGAVLMLSEKDTEHMKMAKALHGMIEQVIKTEAKGSRIPPDRRCLRRGSDGTRAEYDGYWTVNANHKTRPLVVDADGSSVITSQEACPIYAGCFVNAKINIWYQNNQWGKRVNAGLVAIQFVGEGEPLDGSYIQPSEAVKGFDATETHDAFGDQPSDQSSDQSSDTKNPRNTESNAWDVFG